MAQAILADVNSSGIYQIRNLVNGKRYIGSAVRLANRWRQHRCELGKGRHNRKFQNAWRKHGEHAFVFEVIEIVEDKRDLISREQHYIDSLKPEYNIAVTAGSNLGVKWGDETKARMSVANKAIWDREGHREKMSKAHIGYVATEEHRRNLSESTKGRKLSASHAATVAKNNVERNQSEAHRKLMSEFWTGRQKSPDQIAKMAASKRGKPAHNRGKPMSDEQKAKQSAVMKGLYQNRPELRKAISDATRNAMKRPEVIAKIVGANRGRKQSQETIRKRSESIRASCARRKLLRSGGNQ